MNQDEMFKLTVDTLLAIVAADVEDEEDAKDVLEDIQKETRRVLEIIGYGDIV